MFIILVYIIGLLVISTRLEKQLAFSKFMINLIPENKWKHKDFPRPYLGPIFGPFPIQK